MQNEVHSPDLHALGNNLRRRRIALRLTQQDLGDMVNCTSNHIGKIERAETQVSVEMLYRICQALNCSMDQLFAGQFSVGMHAALDEVNKIFQPMSGEQRAAMLELMKKMASFIVEQF